MMTWNKLFCKERETLSTSKEELHRNPFDMDYERIVTSSSLRRLQDKAQVFPLQENDFTRTRLTHSLEVSSLGRSLGRKIGLRIQKGIDGNFSDDYVNQLSSLLMVTGLVHDLGNPPFGHYGEDIIKSWFAKNIEKLNYMNPGKNDFCYFDGNAQTIRILTRLQFIRNKSGINFCYGTLGTLMKYPWSSDDENAKGGKFGYFMSEKDLCEKIKTRCGIETRHPATYILEAADDIAYLFADIEDAVKKCCISWSKISDILKKNNISFMQEILETLNKKEKALRDLSTPDLDINIIMAQNFRIFAQGKCIEYVTDEFINNYPEIMNGNYKKKSLLENENLESFIKDVRMKICVPFAYQNSEVLTLELAGDTILNSLLDKFIPAVLAEDYLKPKSPNGKLYKLISSNFEFIQKINDKNEFEKDKKLNSYERVQLAIDYISGMTDSYALNMHKKLVGMRLP